ncbi:fumarylacetoacetate hydrolase family protein [Rhodoblastus acidophilus]|uniref:Fumarylacetoacetate hydrolase family protein n=1 Tax=Candidatus Rhodoblastus alkanivorans TaxID=2954117 RepID=A0ABS9Z433_9HYPH|nr:fumarylacetoacetate hydrolase family protein [Candidatus Rhodoblastus alkanivorans]MCI4679238.1 fumarylacetoacetate hydrolase family protein [Candidatus Rhodoblastus alkanivorans]MCI4682438.1 fumarylacetoacetate hydrolase family protein [Candidatus Rhodoblastus alkanivorans]MDI4639744.1 fumarylacetoacetate hydrolase family protein [Rhodoblastus acidophilus]
MKLIRFTTANAPNPCFGVVIQEQAVPFNVLQKKAGKSYPYFTDSRSYLANLPESERAAKDLLAWGEQHPGDLGDGEIFPLDAVRLLEPVEVVALYDFGLTPRHLKNSAETLTKYEKDNPQTAPLLQAFAKSVLAPKPKPAAGQPEPLSYYKCNMNSIVGDGEIIPWPAYTSRLDIEPELAVVYGNEKQPVAGFCIFNDVSARDVQAPEFVGGFCLTKDMAKGNQLGPYLVTPDDVGDPYDQEVTVLVNGQVKYRGSTSEISHKAENVFAWLTFIAPLKSGSVIGFGTIPDCTGLDHDDFIDPGAEIQITFERLGTLRCRFAEPAGRLMPSRWPVREPLRQYQS